MVVRVGSFPADIEVRSVDESDIEEDGMGTWVKQNAAVAGVAAFFIATLGIGAIVYLARHMDGYGDLAFMLIPVMIIVGLAVAGSLVTLAAVGVGVVSGRGTSGAPTSGPPH